MALSTSLDAQFGFAKETTYGDGATVTRFIDFVSESFTKEISRIESKAIRKGARTLRSEDWEAGTIGIEGEIELELWNKSFGLLFELMVGGSVTTVSQGGGLYKHSWTPGDLGSGSIEIGRPDVGGTVHRFGYAGCVVKDWELSASVGDPVALKVGFLGKTESTTGSVQTASYASSPELLTFVGGSLTMTSDGATPVDSTIGIKSISYKGTNNVNADRYFLGSQARSKPLEDGLREYSGEFEAEYVDNDIYDIYVAGGEGTLILTFAGATATTTKLVLTSTVRFDGTTPTVGGMEIVANAMKFKAIGASADSDALTLAYFTTDATP